MRSTKNARSAAARVLGRQSYRARLERFGIEYLQRLARENGKKGGRPPKTLRRETQAAQ